MRRGNTVVFCWLVEPTKFREIQNRKSDVTMFPSKGIRGHSIFLQKCSEILHNCPRLEFAEVGENLQMKFKQFQHPEFLRLEVLAKTGLGGTFMNIMNIWLFLLHDLNDHWADQKRRNYLFTRPAFIIWSAPSFRRSRPHFQVFQQMAQNSGQVGYRTPQGNFRKLMTCPKYWQNLPTFLPLRDPCPLFSETSGGWFS